MWFVALAAAVTLYVAIDAEVSQDIIVAGGAGLAGVILGWTGVWRLRDWVSLITNTMEVIVPW